VRVGSIVATSRCLGSPTGQMNTVASMTMGTVEDHHPSMVAVMVDMAEGLAMGMGMGMDEGVAGDELSYRPVRLSYRTYNLHSILGQALGRGLRPILIAMRCSSRVLDCLQLESHPSIMEACL
jgi:hypothetical protein